MGTSVVICCAIAAISGVFLQERHLFTLGYIYKLKFIQEVHLFTIGYL